MDMNISFEQAMKRLDEIVKLLEKGEISLEESIRLYEEGSGLIRFCNEKLNEAEQKVTIIRKENGAYEEVPFEE